MIKFEFSIEETNLILASLAKLPFEVSSELIFKIRSVGQPQAAAMSEAAAETEKETKEDGTA